MSDRLPESGFQNERFEYSRLSPRRQAPIHATVFAVILLPTKEVGPILDGICASAHSTTAGDRFMYHATALSLLTLRSPARDNEDNYI